MYKFDWGWTDQIPLGDVVAVVGAGAAEAAVDNSSLLVALLLLFLRELLVALSEACGFDSCSSSAGLPAASPREGTCRIEGVPAVLRLFLLHSSSWLLVLKLPLDLTSLSLRISLER